MQSLNEGTGILVTIVSPLKDLSNVVLFEDVVQHFSWDGLLQSAQQNALCAAVWKRKVACGLKARYKIPLTTCNPHPS